MDASLRFRLVAAFAAVYLIWGSTYLAIAVGLETMPPFLLAASRFLVAGAALYVWVRARGAPRPTLREWMGTGAMGFFLFMVGNGGVTWAEQRVPSGLTALIIATLSLWMVVFDWARPEGRRPTATTWAGVGLGLGGVLILFGPDALIGAGAVDPVGGLVLMLSALAWSFGSVHGPRFGLPADKGLSTAMQMLTGGLWLTLTSLLAGEPRAFDPTGISLRSAVAWAYLVVFGSIVAYSAYVWLMYATTPARLGTYAFVNPAVAVVLGALILSEPFTARIAFAALLIVLAAAVVTFERTRGAPPPLVAPPRPTLAADEG